MHGIDVKLALQALFIVSMIDLGMVFSLSAGMAWRELQAVTSNRWC